MSILARAASSPPRAASAVSSNRPGGRAFCVAMIAIMGALSISGTEVSASSPGATQEYDLKAVFLFNFAEFVEWPADAFAGASSPFTIGVLGDDPFGRSLDEIVANETVRNRKLVVRRYESVEQIDACQILFISASETTRLDHIFDWLGHRSILTVGETKEFSAHAGAVAFDISQRRLRLRINLAASDDARLIISSKLLRQAQIVRSSGRRK